MVVHFEVRHLLDGRRLLEEAVYFNLGIQKWSAYYRVALTYRSLLKEIRHSGIVAGISYISFALKGSKKI